ncbi:MAG: DNA methylase [Ruminococcaceae bacterium]|nr:DNA methylase [Oscillospiraceae bacterium]
MTNKNHYYIAIDLKSFFASVECVERGLDPLTTNLVVADSTRTEKTICLAVSPSLKSYKIGGRARLFEVVQRVKEVNRERLLKVPDKTFKGSSYHNPDIINDPSLSLNYIVAPPQMAKYMQVSTEIYNVYLKYIAPEDIHVYSIDEVFIDATHYLKTYNMTARELAMKMIRDVLKKTGITATAGIGTNLYLAKIAMDIVAKKMPADKDGVRIAELDEMSYRKELWAHTPITDFWRVGKGYSTKLAERGIFTMGDIARCSIGGSNSYYNEDLLYNLFGINAELLIDHAWGYEPCTIADIKSFKPQRNSISNGQVLQSPYTAEKGKLIAREMTDLLVLDLVDKGLVTDQMVLTVCYDIENLEEKAGKNAYKGSVTTDMYGRKAPKPAHGSINLNTKTSSSKLIINAISELYDRIVDKNLTVRKLYVVANNVTYESVVKEEESVVQCDLFTDYDELFRKKQEEEAELQKEKQIQKAVIKIKKRFGKNAVLKGMNLEEGATTIERNGQVGGHKA